MTEYFKRYRSLVASCLDDKDCDFAKLLDYHKEQYRFFSARTADTSYRDGAFCTLYCHDVHCHCSLAGP